MKDRRTDMEREADEQAALAREEIAREARFEAKAHEIQAIHLLQQAVSELIADINTLVDRIGHESESIDEFNSLTPVTDVPIAPTYTFFMSQIVHHIHWGMANMDLARLVRLAATADMARGELGKRG